MNTFIDKLQNPASQEWMLISIMMILINATAIGLIMIMWLSHGWRTADLLTPTPVPILLDILYFRLVLRRLK